MAPWPRATPAGICLCLALVRVAQGGGEDFGLQAVPKGGDVGKFMDQNLLEPRHAVALLSASEGSKRHLLLKELADDDQLKHVLTFGVQFRPSGSSLVVHRYHYPAETYAGKWTRSAIRAWLLEVGYPLVNRMKNQFAPMKYLTETRFGTVLIVQPLNRQTDELTKALEPYAEKFRDRLKFAFFTKSMGTQKVCDSYGIWSNDELLLMEDPRQVKRHEHSHMPTAPKYRLEEVTPERLKLFFDAYAAGTWPRYYKPAAPRGAPVTQRGIRELTSWDFVEVVNDPGSSVLVEFASANCSNCDEFAAAYGQVARRVQELKQKGKSSLGHVVVARIDQSANEHSETVRGTPWMKYWPRGRRKRPVDVELRSVESIVNFLEERAADEEDGSADEL